MQKRDPRPEIQRLEELALSVKAGDVKLPKFQRPFVWNKTDILKLLDSIYKGYPIGSLLMWNSSQRLTSERSISGLELSSAENISYPTNYLLDGQQRLTALCGALFWRGTDAMSRWNVHFDLEREEFVYPKETGHIHLFPLNRLIDTGDFIRQCMKFEHHERGRQYLANAERLLRAVKDYKIAVVTIGDMTVEEVAPIFERINSTGRKLTIVDLMVAATWSNGFDLNDVIQEILLDVEEADFGTIRDQVVLRSISAASGGGINKEDMQKLRKSDAEQLLRASEATRGAIADAIDFLIERLRIHDFSRVPYALQFTHLVEYFRLVGRRRPDAEDELVRWMWFTSVTRYFASANTGQNAKDLAVIRGFAEGRIDQLYERGPIDISDFLFDRFNLRNSSSIAFTMLLASAMPAESIDGRPLENGYLSVKDSGLYSSVLSSLRSNIAYIVHPYSDAPNLPFAINLAQHFLDDRCLEQVLQRDAGGFCNARGEKIAEAVGMLTECDVYFQPSATLVDVDSYLASEDF